MTKIKIILFLLVAFLSPTMLMAVPTSVKDSLLYELSQASTPQDSIPILYHLIDLSVPNYNVILYEAAGRCNNASVQADLIRYTCNIYLEEDSLMALCQINAEELPDSYDKKETLTFIKVNRMAALIRVSSEAEKMKMVQKLIGESKLDGNGDLYDEILQLYTLCLYLGSSTQGELYIQYVEKLEKLIKQLPPEGSHVLPTLFYTQAAILYTRNEEYAKAIAADKEILKIIDRLSREYKKQGRVFRNYDISYYNCYRRMLSNYPALTPQEVEEYYQRILELRPKNARIEMDYQVVGRPLIYYLMATKQYTQALSNLKKYINVPNNKASRMQFLRFMTEAAKAVGDDATLLQATTEYNTMLEEYNNLKAAEKYKELQILYDVNELKAENAQLELEKQEAEIESSKTIIHITLIAITILLFLLGIAFWLYYRAKRLAGSLQRSKQKLQKEQENLLKTQKELTIARDQAESANRMKTLFIQNMSHEIRTPLNAIVGFAQVIAENAKESEKEEMGFFAQTVNGNSELLLTLVGDVLDIAKMESGEIKVNFQPCSLQSICGLAINNTIHKTKPGVKMYFQTDAPGNITLLTDATRLEQVLINFLTNAAKFTNEGEIVLSYSVDESNRNVVFSVTDTGIGVPVEKAEVIFERFEKLDSFAQGTGLGLHICKLIAKLLKGKVMMDTSYKGGARFLFIHPIL